MAAVYLADDLKHESPAARTPECITQWNNSSELEAAKKAVAQHRREIAALKRRNTALARTVSYLQSRETKRLKAEQPPQGTRFSVRSLQAQRRRAGGVSQQTLYNWEGGGTKPDRKHLATLVSLRGIGKREARRRLTSLEAQ